MLAVLAFDMFALQTIKKETPVGRPEFLFFGFYAILLYLRVKALLR